MVPLISTLLVKMSGRKNKDILLLYYGGEKTFNVKLQLFSYLCHMEVHRICKGGNELGKHDFYGWQKR